MILPRDQSSCPWSRSQGSAAVSGASFTLQDETPGQQRVFVEASMTIRGEAALGGGECRLCGVKQDSTCKWISTWTAVIPLKVSKLSESAPVRPSPGPQPLLYNKTKIRLNVQVHRLQSHFCLRFSVYFKWRHVHLIEERARKFSLLTKCAINCRFHGLVYNMEMLCFKPMKCTKFQINKQIS